MSNYAAVAVVDPAVARLLSADVSRLTTGVTLIASENHASPAVRAALSGSLTDKYAEGYPKARYYPGNEFADAVECLTIDRAKQLFGAGHANVQPHSGADANIAALHALRVLRQPQLRPQKDGPERPLRILSMSLPHGGHLSHGWPVTKVGKDYQVKQYGVRQEDHHVDMDQVASMARDFQPDVIIAGFSAYPGKLDFAQFREIADRVGAHCLADIAHVAGLVVAGLYPNPVPHAHVVSTTTHKTLRGPRGGLIVCQDGPESDLAKQLDRGVFPGVQGGPQMHSIAAKAVAFHEALQPSFRGYQQQVLANAVAMAEVFQEEAAASMPFGITENHLILLDVTQLGTTGKAAQAVLEAVGIFANMNAIPFDLRKPFDPSGIRVGTPAITTRGFMEDESRELAKMMVRLFRSGGDEAVKREVAGRVRELAQAHPVYTDWVPADDPSEDERTG